MDSTISEEMQAKLLIIEKEMDFSKEMSPPDKKWIISRLLLCLIAIVFSLNNKNYIEIAFFFIVGAFNIACYLDYKKFHKLYSNARDIINYYRNREAKNET